MTVIGSLTQNWCSGTVWWNSVVLPRAGARPGKRYRGYLPLREELCGWNHVQLSFTLGPWNHFCEMSNQKLPLKS